MAFELPDHLPRGGLAQDTPTQVLTKLGQTTNATLNATLAASWLGELESSIQATKDRISRRIHDGIPAFERQLQSSTSIQARLSDLSTTVDALEDSLNNPKTGILPTLLQKLTAHKNLSAQTHDSETIHRVSGHLLRIRRDLYELSEQVQQGQLPESAQACVRLERLIAEAPEPLDKAVIMTSIQKRYRTLSDRLQEQLNDAYTRSVMFSSSNDTVSLTILSSASVPPTSTVISLSAILQSLTPDSLSTSLSGFRRNLISKFIDVVLLSLRPISVTTSGSLSSISLSLSLTSSTPLQSLSTLMTFLNSYFFPHLPPTQASFPDTLHAPISNSILIHLLEPSIPSSLPALPSFLKTVDEAVHFEGAFLSGSNRDRSIRNWVTDVAGHYEKRRRENFLRQAREVISGPEDGFTVRTEVSGSSVIEDTDVDVDDPWDDDAWSTDPAPVLPPSQEPEAADTVDDDPWDDDNWPSDPVPSREPEPAREFPGSIPKGPPKIATRLERFSAKAKALSAPNTHTNGTLVGSHVSNPPSPQLSASPPPYIKPQKEQETYPVSLRARKVLEIAVDALREGQELMKSNAFAKHCSTESAMPGQLLIAAAPLMLDLYRALYPVAHSTSLLRDPTLVMRMSIDCKFLSTEVAKLCHSHGPASAERWLETAERLMTLGELCYENAMERQQEIASGTSDCSTEL